MLPSLTKINKSLCFGNIILRNLSKSPKIQFENTENEKKLALPLENRFLYREFLPDPEMKFRNAIREKLERSDMIKRRSAIDIPSFFVGSIVSVTSADHHDPNKTRKFVGICIQKRYTGLRHEFVLRNVIDNLGVEMAYNMYDPTIHNITVLRLEKRLDDELLYLRDALPKYSTFPLDMETEYLPLGAPIPINDIKVEMKPRPWVGRWERKGFKGIDNVDKHITEKMKGQKERVAEPWEKYDLMKEYRRTIPEEEQDEIFSEVFAELHKLSVRNQKMKKSRVYVKPKKTG
uniref:Large ribosomal subunit protein bL19m n=1 Tax=Cacopsylla melanoneura TaxID=428564 RepID=A0A8D8LD24_9HEMI